MTILTQTNQAHAATYLRPRSHGNSAASSTGELNNDRYELVGLELLQRIVCTERRWPDPRKGMRARIRQPGWRRRQLAEIL